MSVDGYIAGPGDPGGDGFMRLHEWYGCGADLTLNTKPGAAEEFVAERPAMLDELQIHQIPVLFGAGRRLFDVLGARVELEVVRVIDTPDATHIRYRVVR
jgi:hypothetical protein